MPVCETFLSKQEKKWILERRVTRLTDQKEIQIYPMGAERFLSSALAGHQPDRYNIRADICGKNVLLIPGHGNSSFLFAQAGAKSIAVYDKDPVTIAWMKAFKKYYSYRAYDARGRSLPSIGELITALTCWYPPLLTLPHNKMANLLFWVTHPNSLRRIYIHYMLSLVQKAVQDNVSHQYELNHNIQFYVGTIDQLRAFDNNITFDTAFIPYLLGVKNGIEQAKDIVYFIKQLIEIIPEGSILITPSKDTKEHFFMGKSYFITSGYSELAAIPELKGYLKSEDQYWFRTQGLVQYFRQI